LSGENSIELLSRCFSRPQTILNSKGGACHYGWIIDGVLNGETNKPEKIDETLLTVYRAPRSYTGEDGADVVCHGGFAAPAAVMKTLLKNGFREALRGEFTYRAFINGKIDLTGAESVMEIVGSKTDAARRSSVRRLSGVLQNEINAVKALLLKAAAEIELNLDYSEIDGVGLELDAGEMSASSFPGKKEAVFALERLKVLLELYETQKLETDGALVVLAGKPNAGKSSLFNLLLKEERSIVTDVPGTTRDWIEGRIVIDGVPVRLVDSAGVHETENPVEKIGIERSLELMREADLVLYVIDGESEEASEYEEPAGNNENRFFLWNKADKKPIPKALKEKGVLEVSAANSFGATDLTKKIAFFLRSKARSGEKKTELFFTREGLPCPGTERQRTLIAQSAGSLEEAFKAASSSLPLDIIAPYIRDAMDALGEITGEVATDDILETIFSSFCVGK
jgi:tRNA modification GTPase